MTTIESNLQNPSLPCSWQSVSTCKDCSLAGKTMCRFEAKDSLNFLMLGLPFFVTAIAGTIHAGYGWYLFLWLAYSLFFFFVWEARVLCSHCPMWAEESRVLHCHANYGVIKIWKYRPGPMSQSERAQFIIGALIWLGVPLALMAIGQAYLLAVIGLITAVSAGYSLREFTCSRCINFSCPMNAVPKETVDAYLARNPAMRAAWEADGYRPGK